MRRVNAYDVVRVCLAGVLLLAAGLKGYQLATEPALGTGLLDSRWLLIAVVEFELFFGLWLLVNIWPEWTRRKDSGSLCYAAHINAPAVAQLKSPLPPDGFFMRMNACVFRYNSLRCLVLVSILVNPITGPSN